MEKTNPLFPKVKNIDNGSNSSGSRLYSPPTQNIQEGKLSNAERYLEGNSYFGDPKAQEKAFESQSFGERLAIAINPVGMVAKVGLGLIENIGYAGALVSEWGNEKDYSNAIIDWAKERREDLRSNNNWALGTGEIFTRDPEATWDAGSAAWWLKHGEDLIESISEFAVTGMGYGSLTSKVAKAVAKKSLALGNAATKIGQGMTASNLAYFEGAMSGHDIYKDFYAKSMEQNAHLPWNDRVEKAKNTASEAAAGAVRTNTQMNTALNLTGISPFFRSSGVRSAKIRKLAKPLEGENLTTPDGLKAWTDRLKKVGASDQEIKAIMAQDMVAGGLMSGKGAIALEMLQESLEEVNNVYSEYVGEAIGNAALEGKKLSMSDKIMMLSEYTDATFTQEGALSAFLGALGGGGQKMITTYAPINRITKKDSEGNIIYKTAEDGQKADAQGYLINDKGERMPEMRWGSAFARENAEDAQFYKDNLNILIEDLENIEDYKNKLEKAVEEGDEPTAASMRYQLFNTTLLGSLMNGSSEYLANEFKTLEAVDNTRDLEEVYAEQISAKSAEIDQAKQNGEEIGELQAQLSELKKLEAKFAGKTEAMVKGLALNKDDKTYKEEAKEAIEFIEKASQELANLESNYAVADPYTEQMVDTVMKLWVNKETYKKAEKKYAKALEEMLEDDSDNALTESSGEVRKNLENYVKVADAAKKAEKYRDALTKLKSKNAAIRLQALEEALSDPITGTKLSNMGLPNAKSAVKIVEKALKKSTDEFNTLAKDLNESDAFKNFAFEGDKNKKYAEYYSSLLSKNFSNEKKEFAIKKQRELEGVKEARQKLEETYKELKTARGMDDYISDLKKAEGEIVELDKKTKEVLGKVDETKKKADEAKRAGRVTPGPDATEATTPQPKPYIADDTPPETNLEIDNVSDDDTENQKDLSTLLDTREKEEAERKADLERKKKEREEVLKRNPTQGTLVDKLKASNVSMVKGAEAMLREGAAPIIRSISQSNPNSKVAGQLDKVEKIDAIFPTATYSHEDGTVYIKEETPKGTVLYNKATGRAVRIDAIYLQSVYEDHNPTIEKLKEKYPDLFAEADKASAISDFKDSNPLAHLTDLGKAFVDALKNSPENTDSALSDNIVQSVRRVQGSQQSFINLLQAMIDSRQLLDDSAFESAEGFTKVLLDMGVPLNDLKQIAEPLAKMLSLANSQNRDLFSPIDLVNFEGVLKAFNLTEADTEIYLELYRKRHNLKKTEEEKELSGEEDIDQVFNNGVENDDRDAVKLQEQEDKRSVNIGAAYKNRAYTTNKKGIPVPNAEDIKHEDELKAEDPKRIKPGDSISVYSEKKMTMPTAEQWVNMTSAEKIAFMDDFDSPIMASHNGEEILSLHELRWVIAGVNTFLKTSDSTTPQILGYEILQKFFNVFFNDNPDNRIMFKNAIEDIETTRVKDEYTVFDADGEAIVITGNILEQMLDLAQQRAQVLTSKDPVDFEVSDISLGKISFLYDNSGKKRYAESTKALPDPSLKFTIAKKGEQFLDPDTLSDPYFKESESLNGSISVAIPVGNQNIHQKLRVKGLDKSNVDLGKALITTFLNPGLKKSKELLTFFDNEYGLDITTSTGLNRAFRTFVTHIRGKNDENSRPGDIEFLANSDADGKKSVLIQLAGGLRIRLTPEIDFSKSMSIGTLNEQIFGENIDELVNFLNGGEGRSKTLGEIFEAMLLPESGIPIRNRVMPKKPIRFRISDDVTPRQLLNGSGMFKYPVVTNGILEVIEYSNYNEYVKSVSLTNINGKNKVTTDGKDTYIYFDHRKIFVSPKETQDKTQGETDSTNTLDRKENFRDFDSELDSEDFALSDNFQESVEQQLKDSNITLEDGTSMPVQVISQASNYIAVKAIEELLKGTGNSYKDAFKTVETKVKAHFQKMVEEGKDPKGYAKALLDNDAYFRQLISDDSRKYSDIADKIALLDVVEDAKEEENNKDETVEGKSREDYSDKSINPIKMMDGKLRAVLSLIPEITYDEVGNFKMKRDYFGFRIPTNPERLSEKIFTFLNNVGDTAEAKIQLLKNSGDPQLYALAKILGKEENFIQNPDGNFSGKNKHQIRNAFFRFFSKSNTEHYMTTWSNYSYAVEGGVVKGISFKTFNANRNKAQVYLPRDWQARLTATALDKKGDHYAYYDEDGNLRVNTAYAKQLLVDYDKSVLTLMEAVGNNKFSTKESLASLRTHTVEVSNLLKKIGISILPSSLFQLVNPETAQLVLKNTGLAYKAFSIFIGEYNNLSKEFKKGSNTNSFLRNIFNSAATATDESSLPYSEVGTDISRLSFLAYMQGEVESASSFKNHNNDNVHAVQLDRAVVKRSKVIKDKNVAAEMILHPFQSGSIILQQAAQGMKVIFEPISSSAIRKSRSSKGDADDTILRGQDELQMIAMFLNNGTDTAQTFNPTHSDKPHRTSTLSSRIISVNLNALENGKLEQRAYNPMRRVLYQMIKGEVSRVILGEEGKMDMIEYDIARKYFIFFPELNEHRLRENIGKKLYNGETITKEKIDSIYKNGQLQYSPTDSTGQSTLDFLTDFMVGYMIRAGQNRVSVWKDFGFDSLRSLGAKKFVDKISPTLSSPSNKNAVMKGLATMIEFQSIYNSYNYMAIIGNDPAIYATKAWLSVQSNPTADNIEAAIKSTLDNSSKRLAKDVAPKEDTDNLVYRKVDGKYQWVRETQKRIAVLGEWKIKDGPTLEALNKLEPTETNKALRQAIYDSLDGADAAEFITAQAALDILHQEGRLTDESYTYFTEALDRNDGFLGKDPKTGESIAKKLMTDFGALTAGKPVTVGRQPVIKNGIHVGYVEQYIKSAKFPLFKDVVKDLELENLYTAMRRGGIHSAPMQSAVKLGQQNVNNIFEDGSIKQDLELKFITVNHSDIGAQQQIPEKKTMLTTLVSQMDKLITDGIYDTKFDINGESKDGAELRELKETVMKRRYEIGINRLRSKLGIESRGNNWEITNFKKFINVLKGEMQARGADSNQLRYLRVKSDNEVIQREIDVGNYSNVTMQNSRFEVPPYFNPLANKLESLVISIIQKTVDRKMYGKSFVQMPSMGFRNKVLSFDDLAASQTEGITYIKYADESLNFNPAKGLQFIRKEKSTDSERVLPMQVIVSPIIKLSSAKTVNIRDFMKDGFLDTERVDPEILKMIGARIPNQGFSSMIPIQIVGFLPEYMRDMIVVPPEITGQMGSDFDVDKLFTYLKGFDVITEEKEGKKITKLQAIKGDINSTTSSLRDSDLISSLQKLVQESLDIAFATGKGKGGKGRIITEETIQFDRRAAFEKLLEEDSIQEDLGELFLEHDPSVPHQEAIKIAIEEYKKLHGARGNDSLYFDIHWSVLTNKEMFDKITEPLDMPDLNITKQKLANLKKRDSKAFRRNHFSALSQQDVMFSNRAGKVGTALAANQLVLNSIMQSNAEDKKIKLVSSAEGVIYDSPFEFYVGDKLFKFDNLSGYESFNVIITDKDGTVNKFKRSKTMHLAALLGASVDNAKLQQLDANGLDQHTLKVALIMAMLSSGSGKDHKGLSLNTIVMFNNQPIVQEFIKELNLLEDKATGTYSVNSKRDAADKIKDIYKKKIGQESDVRFAVPNDTTLEKMIAKADNLSLDEMLQQLSILDTWLELDQVFDAVNKIRKGISADPGPSVFSIEERLEFNIALKKTAETNDGHNLQIGITAGDRYFLNSEKLVDTQYGAHVDSILLPAREILGQLFPYTGPVYTKVFENLKVFKSDFNSKDRRKVSNYIKALYTAILLGDLVDADSVRRDAYFTDNSLHRELIRAKESYAKDNDFIKALSIEYRNDEPYIYFKVASADILNNDRFIQGWLQLASGQYNLETETAEDARLRARLAERLFDYTIATGGVQGATNFVKHLPNAFLLGNNAETLHNIVSSKLNDTDSIAVFDTITQIMQHEPDLVDKNVPYKSLLRLGGNENNPGVRKAPESWSITKWGKYGVVEENAEGKKENVIKVNMIAPLIASFTPKNMQDLDLEYLTEDFKFSEDFKDQMAEFPSFEDSGFYPAPYFTTLDPVNNRKLLYVYEGSNSGYYLYKRIDTAGDTDILEFNPSMTSSTSIRVANNAVPVGRNAIINVESKRDARDHVMQFGTPAMRVTMSNIWSKLSNVKFVIDKSTSTKGSYNHGTRTITLNPDEAVKHYGEGISSQENMARVIFEEFSHAAYYAARDIALANLDSPSGKRYVAAVNRIVVMMRQLRNDLNVDDLQSLYDILRTNYRGSVESKPTAQEREAAHKEFLRKHDLTETGEKDKLDFNEVMSGKATPASVEKYAVYALANPLEFVASVIKDEKLQRLLAEKDYDSTETKSILQKFFEVLKDFIDAVYQNLGLPVDQSKMLFHALRDAAIVKNMSPTNDSRDYGPPPTTPDSNIPPGFERDTEGEGVGESVAPTTPSTPVLPLSGGQTPLSIPSLDQNKLFNPLDKQLKKGSVVMYNGKKYLFWNENKGKAQLINTNGTKFSGTPNLDKLTVMGSYATTMYNNTEYIVTDKGNIYSGATGNIVYAGKDNSSVTIKNRIIEAAKQNIQSNPDEALSSYPNRAELLRQGYQSLGIGPGIQVANAADVVSIANVMFIDSDIKAVLDNGTVVLDVKTDSEKSMRTAKLLELKREMFAEMPDSMHQDIAAATSFDDINKLKSKYC